MADDSGDGARPPRGAHPDRRGRCVSGTRRVDATRRWSRGSTRPARALVAAGHRARRPRRGVGTELDRVDRRRARHHHRRRRARAGQHAVQGRRGGVRARAQRRARCSSRCAGSSTPTTPRCSPTPASRSPRSSTRSCSSGADGDGAVALGRLPRARATRSPTPRSTRASPRSAPTTRATSCSRRARPGARRAS